MARKTKEEALRARQLLIESTIQQFAPRGVTNTTLANIADTVGVARGAIYWHFTSRTELFNETQQRQSPPRDLIQQNLTTKNKQEPLKDLRQRLITSLHYIAKNPRQCALMQILYQRCGSASDMLSESEVRQHVGFNYSTIGGILQCCMRNSILPAEINIDVILTVLHSAFSGSIKSWLFESQHFDLYQQAPALMDNIMVMVCVTRLPQEPVPWVVNQ